MKFTLLISFFIILCSQAADLWNLQTSEWEELDNLISGSIVLPTDDNYVTSYVLWSATWDQVYPEAIIYASDKYDVSIIWKWLLTKTDDISEKLITVRCGSHSLDGWSTTYGVILDVRNLQNLELSDYMPTLDNGQQVKSAYVGPGVDLALFTAWAEDNDVTLPHGDCASVTFGGFLLGGGFGVTSRTFGMGVDWINSMDVVLVETGELVTINSENEYSDLFWAMKGGGQAHYAILVEYYMNIPWKELTEPGLYISLEWDWSEENWDKLSSVWSDYVTNEDYENQFAIYLRIQPVDTLGTDYYINYHGFWTGEQSSGLAMLASLYSDIGIAPTSSKIEYDHFEGWIEPSNPDRYRYSNLCKNRLKIDSTEIDTELFNNMYTQVETLRSYEPPSDQDSTDNYNYPTQFMFLAPGGGAIKYHTTEDSAFPWRDTEYLYVACSRWESTNTESYQYAKTWLGETMDALEPYLSTTASFVNFPDGDLDNYLDLYYGSSLERLITIKEKYNPKNIFQHPQSILANTDTDNDDTYSSSSVDQYIVKPRDPGEVTIYDTYLNSELTTTSLFPDIQPMTILPNNNDKVKTKGGNHKKTKKVLKGNVASVHKSISTNMKKKKNTKKRDEFLEKYGMDETDVTTDNDENNNDLPESQSISKDQEDHTHKHATSQASAFIKSIPLWAYIVLAFIVATTSVYYYKRKIFYEKNPVQTKYTKLNMNENDYVAIGTSNSYSTFEENNVVL